MKTREEFQQLMALGVSPKLPTDALFLSLAKLIDASGDLNEISGIERAFRWLKNLKNEKLSPLQNFEFYYFKGNAWNARRKIEELNVKKGDWNSINYFIEQEIINLRTAIRCAPDNTDALCIFRLCQTYTNIGSLLDSMGRFVEAIWYYDQALKKKSDFTMALGNKALALRFYGQHHYDPGHRNLFSFFILDLLTQAFKNPKYFEGNAENFFKSFLKDVKNYLGEARLSDFADMENHSLGIDELEIKHREWCLKERLFLNPLNDLGPYPIAARDVLLTPSMRAGIKESPYLQGFFSWMKQEYVSARFLLFEGIKERQTHFSDKETFLVDTLDYPAYGYRTELLKSAFRAFYSILDKIAFFINDYFKLEINERTINYRNIWENEKLQTMLSTEKNFPLQGLYWLSKDIFNPKDYRDVLEPEAKHWSLFRNAMEHRYLKIINSPLSDSYFSNDEFKDPLAYTLNKEHFIKSITSLARLIRAALIYLSFSINSEEKKNSETEEGFIPEMPLFIYRDQDKI